MRSRDGDRPGQHGETLFLLKIQKLAGHAPVVPATWEAEAGEALESVRQRLQGAEIAPLHSSLGNKVRPGLNQSVRGQVRWLKKPHLYQKYQN